MIKSVNELQAYLFKDGEDYKEPAHRQRFLMTSPGCSKEEIEKLKETLPRIPDTYTKWTEAVNLNGVSVGYFEVSPGSCDPEGMVANLIQNNKGSTYQEYAKQRHLYFIAARDGFEVYVAAQGGPFQEGEIILISCEIWGDKEHPDRWIYRLAKDFEQFLIAAGNLNQIHREIKDDYSNQDEKVEEFFDRLKKLGVSEEYFEGWRKVFW